MRSNGLTSIRGRLVAVAAIAGAFAVATPVSSANAQITPIGFPAGGGIGLSSQGCAGGIVGAAGAIAGDGGAPTQVSCGAGLTFIGPTIGSISSVIGPTIIGGTVLGPVTVSNGGSIVGSVP